MNPAGDNTLEAVGEVRANSRGFYALTLTDSLYRVQIRRLKKTLCCWPAFAGQFLSDYAFWALETAVAIAWRRDMKPRHCSER
jgi:hypothetical protein